MLTIVILDGPAKSVQRHRIKAEHILRMVREGITLNSIRYRATGKPVHNVLVLRSAR